MSLMTISSGKITDSASIVPISIVTDVIGSRALDTEYQNTVGKTLIITVSFLAYSPAVNSAALGYMRVNSVPGNLGARDQWLGGKRFNADTSIGQELFSGTVLVPPDFYYNLKTLDAFEGTVTLKSWVESY